MVGSHEADENRLTGRVARAPRSRPSEHLPVVESGSVDENDVSPDDPSLVAPQPADPRPAVTRPVDPRPAVPRPVDPSVAPAEPEIETVTRLMGFLRESGDAAD